MKKSVKLIDLDCANCAAKIEDAVKKIDGVTNASVSFMAQKMTLEAPDDKFAQVLDDYIWLRLENKLKSYTESITLRQLVDFYNKESAENVSEPMYYI